MEKPEFGFHSSLIERVECLSVGSDDASAHLVPGKTGRPWRMPEGALPSPGEAENPPRKVEKVESGLLAEERLQEFPGVLGIGKDPANRRIGETSPVVNPVRHLNRELPGGCEQLEMQMIDGRKRSVGIEPHSRAGDLRPDRIDERASELVVLFIEGLGKLLIGVGNEEGMQLDHGELVEEEPELDSVQLTGKKAFLKQERLVEMETITIKLLTQGVRGVFRRPLGPKRPEHVVLQFPRSDRPERGWFERPQACLCHSSKSDDIARVELGKWVTVRKNPRPFLPFFEWGAQPSRQVSEKVGGKPCICSG